MSACPAAGALPKCCCVEPALNEHVEYLEPSLAAERGRALLLGRMECRFGQGPSDTCSEDRAPRAKDVPIGNELQIEHEAPNTAARADEEIVLLYAQAVYSSVTWPLLKALQRVSLSPRETNGVSWVLDPTAPSLLDLDLSWGAGVTGTSWVEVPVPPARCTNGCTYS
jgi:hypothetical protein